MNNVQTKTVDTSSYLEQMPVIETIHSQTLLTGPDTHIASVVETHQLGQVQLGCQVPHLHHGAITTMLPLLMLNII